MKKKLIVLETSEDIRTKLTDVFKTSKSRSHIASSYDVAVPGDEITFVIGPVSPSVVKDTLKSNGVSNFIHLRAFIPKKMGHTLRLCDRNLRTIDVAADYDEKTLSGVFTIFETYAKKG